MTRAFAHAFDYARDGRHVDLHWAFGAHVSYRIDYDAIFERREVFCLGGCEMAVLADEDVLHFQLLGMFEDLARGTARLRAFVDLYRILVELDGSVGWHEFWRLRREERTFGVCRSALWVFLSLFGGEGPFEHPAAAAGVPSPDLSRAARLVEARPGSFANKAWAAACYECPRALSAAWWLVSLPHRLAVYQPGIRRQRLALRRRPA
ncbi:MAG: nucleotidyltransferase family protein [Gammaproteobacteria bacterium]|nr:nucleotidyltransferase family protein [Gammaproteobacteria bacterium]